MNQFPQVHLAGLIVILKFVANDMPSAPPNGVNAALDIETPETRIDGPEIVCEVLRASEGMFLSGVPACVPKEGRVLDYGLE
jgi:hypothetical protein